MRTRRTWGRPAVLAALLLVPATAAPGVAYTRPTGVTAVASPADGIVAKPLAVSADGRRVAFAATGTGLAPNRVLPPARDGDEQVYLRDTATGGTELVSVDASGQPAWDPMPPDPKHPEGHRTAMSGGVALSDDGRVVAFTSWGWNLAGVSVSKPDPEDLPPHASVLDTNLSCDVFVRDLHVSPPRTERVSVASDGTQAGGALGKTTETCDSWGAALSADGRYVAFVSTATNLVPGDTNGVADVFVRDRLTQRTERVSVTTKSDRDYGASGVDEPGGVALSDDGRYVAYAAAGHVYVRDRKVGTTDLVDRALGGGAAMLGADTPSISGNGRFVAFHSASNDLVPTNARDGRVDYGAFVRDRTLGRTYAVAVTGAGEPGATHDPAWRAEQCCGLYLDANAISGDGRWVVFRTDEPNLDGWPGSWQGTPTSPYGVYAYVYDRTTGEVAPLVTPRLNGRAPDQQAVALSPGGRYAAVLAATGTGAAAKRPEVFLVDRGPALGIGGIAGSVVQGRLRLSGRVSFAGAVLAAPGDAANDARPPDLRALGGEAVGGAVVYRPERGDVLFRFALAGLPQTRSAATPTGQDRYLGTAGGDPRLEYVAAFTSNGASYEARATVQPVVGNPPLAGTFGLYRCDEGNVPQCAKVADLHGGIGTTGAEVRLAVPLAAAAIGEGRSLTGLHLWVRSTVPVAGSTETNPIVDDVRVDTAQAVGIPVRRVTVTVAYDTPGRRAVRVAAGFANGVLTASVPASAGRHRYTVTVRTCLLACVTQRFAVTA